MADTDVRSNKETEMTQMTQEQQQAQALAERLVAKLRDFRAGLPVDEQMALDLALRRSPGGELDDDVTGFAPNRGVVAVAAKVFVYYITHATPIWSDDYPDFPYTGATSSSNPEFRGGWNGTHVH